MQFVFKYESVRLKIKVASAQMCPFPVLFLCQTSQQLAVLQCSGKFLDSILLCCTEL